MQSNEWIEIVFESIALKKIPALLNDLTENGALISNYSTNHENDEIRWDKEEAILEFLNAHSNFCLFVNLFELRCEDFKIPKCCIAIYHQEGGTDLELNFELKELDESLVKTLIEKLMKLAKSLASKYHMTNYYCGLDPAIDLDTRFFTQDQVGPLSLS